MKTQKIAIIGLGRVGSVFLEKVSKLRFGVTLDCVAELGDTPGKMLAAEKGIPIATLDEIIAKGESIDVIFDLSGSTTVRKALREKLATAGNQHTIIAPESIARLVWNMMGLETELPDPGGRSGY